MYLCTFQANNVVRVKVESKWRTGQGSILTTGPVLLLVVGSEQYLHDQAKSLSQSLNPPTQVVASACRVSNSSVLRVFERICMTRMYENSTDKHVGRMQYTRKEYQRWLWKLKHSSRARSGQHCTGNIIWPVMKWVIKRLSNMFSTHQLGDHLM